MAQQDTNGQPEAHTLLYDWNTVESRAPITTKPVVLLDETLRDGIQSPSATDPAIEDKLELLRLMDGLGIAFADIGLPGASKRQFDDVMTMAKMIQDEGLKIRPTAACRTVVSDIEPVVEISQKLGLKIEVYTFIGSSPIRQFAEEWDVDFIAKTSQAAIDFCVQNDLPVTYVTEDTTRSRPDTLDTLFRMAVEHGAKGLCLCDTVGHATPDGIARLIKWTKNLLKGMGAEDTLIDWHGHNDRGMAVANALWAIEAGADRIHGTALGIGERVGNCSMDQLIVNLKLLGVLGDQNVSNLGLYCQLAARACGYPIPKNYPVVGHDAFRTGTGVHAAAIIKAKGKGDKDLADRVYSGVPAHMFGRDQEIEIGFMSGRANVVFWLKHRHVEPSDTLVEAILAKAKQSKRILTDEEVWSVVHNAPA